MACSKSSKNMVDFFSNAPDIVIDKILEGLPIRMAAQTSVLSKQWRRAWLSLKNLSFDRDFLGEQKKSVRQKWSRIICNILLYHNGPVHNFKLYIPFDISKDCTSYGQWISFLSKNGVKEIIISNPYSEMDITSYIFHCSEIVVLFLIKGSLNPPPTDFTGFPNLRSLVLLYVHFKKPDVFPKLIENCKMLENLELRSCLGLDHVVLDLPRLQSLKLLGHFESLVFRNVRCLRSINLCPLTMREKLLTVDTFELLANSCQLQSITFDGPLCKLFTAGGIIRSSSVTFNHLHELCLSRISSTEFGVLRDLLSMIGCCPYIKKLEIRVFSSGSLGHEIIDLNYDYKLNHLREVIISGITGSSTELKLVEVLLAVSTVLENMFIRYSELIESEPKKLIALMGFPRASSKARLLFP